MAKNESKNIINIVLAASAVLLLMAVIVYAWNLPGSTKKESTCNVKVKDGTPAEVNNLGPNEIKITAENFEKEVVNTKGVVLVDAYAPWCPHCQKIAPTISKIADDYVGKVKVGRMNSDNQDEKMKANFDFAIKNGLEGYPTLWIYKDGKKVETFSGERTYCELKEVLDNYLK